MKHAKGAMFLTAVVCAAACGDVDRPAANVYAGSGAVAINGGLAGTTASSPRQGSPAPVTATTTTPVSSGDSLAGNLGAVRGFASDAVSVRATRGGASVRLDATDAAYRWWAMAQLDFGRPLSDPAWTVGMVRTFDSETPTVDGLSVRLVGCSGPRADETVFDASPRQVTVRINAGSTPDTRQVQFEATWPDALNTVRGSFEYSLR